MSYCRRFTNDCVIDTIELDEERGKEAIENVKKIGVSDRINIMIGDAVDVLPTLDLTYEIYPLIPPKYHPL